ncbi:hypothetical protein [Acinetobacter gerneri]|uniref:Uncharacterized protein n=1 Tax=Acinetobacter gerneri DSM 14967 = CIP 107464 = MTCC 9824 TaxID=1120926 RepID=N8ZT09_9GAMM|nr:hypothetical protein [Acinetobacter gerneri]ENV34585.1 hypothetical protein F960_01324 [Acinetobacter gerneri DSM 14967 = CIP 107464 = MTCC 9824]EPR85197.1 hypothetical protein L289_0377 [Acinetobacter gerneri DSM 14967 = CIP 107464 = MTCC 9824]
MKQLTVLQLSKQTGLSRTQIYYLASQNKINIINGKIDLNEAMPAIIELLDKKSNKDKEINYKQILNLLISQNILLQTQLNLAHEREKMYLTEFARYQQNLPSKPAIQPPIVEGNAQAKLKCNGNENIESQNQMEYKRDNQARLESCQNINKVTSSVNEVESHSNYTESIYNAMTSPKSESVDTGWIKQTKEMVEQNPDALIGTRLPNQDEREQLLNLKRQIKSTAQVAKVAVKKVSIPLTARNPNRKPTNETNAEQDDLKKEDHHNSKQ